MTGPRSDTGDRTRPGGLRRIGIAGVLAALLLPAAAGAQATMDGFRAAFGRAVDGLYQIQGAAAARASAAAAALDELAGAETLLAELDLPESRRAQLSFFLGVRRAEIHWRLATEESKARAVTLGLAGRDRAHRDHCYTTYYRAILLILLSTSMPERDFLAMLDDELGDGDYLRGPSSQRDVDKLRKGLSGYAGHLAMLRAWIDLTRRPAWAVRELQQLGLELKQLSGPSAASLRDECYSRLAWHFIELRAFDRAKIYLAEIATADARYPRAVIDYKQGDYAFCRDEARELYAQAPRPEYLQLLANAEERLAQQAFADDDEAKARRLWESAFGHYRDAAGMVADAPLSAAASFNGCGDCCLGLGRFDEAEQHYRRGLELLESQASWTGRAEQAETFKDLGRLGERRGHSAAALDDFGRALTAVEEIRRGIPLDALGIAWLEPGQLEAVDGVLRLCRAGAATPLRALTTVDRMKARGLLDWLHHPPTPADLGDYRATLGALARAGSDADVRRYRLRLERARTAAGKRNQAEALEERGVQELLASHGDAVFLEYWTGKDLGESVYLICATADRIDLIDLGSVVEGRARYRAAHAAVRVPTGDPWPPLDRAASFLLPEAVRRCLPAGAPVVVCTDVEMSELPIEAFRLEGVPLGIRNPVYRVPSLAVMARLGRREATSTRSLVLDSAVSSPADRELHGLSDLQFSAAEGELVAELHQGGVRRSGDQATYSQLAALLPEGGFGALHLSCHAIDHGRIPSASLLMLSDGPLDMASLATLPLRGMLVVFSACRSAGAGDQGVGGEGVRGLLWGPFAAGARCVVASHWEMNQQATKDLMGQFHAHVVAGDDAGVAMQRARATLAAASNYRHPSYWAGFGVFASPPATTDLPVDRSSDRSVQILWSTVGILAILGWFVWSRRSRFRGAQTSDCRR